MALVGHPSDLRSFARHCALTHHACLSHETSLFFLLMLFSKCVTSSTQVPWGLEGFFSVAERLGPRLHSRALAE